MSLLKHIINIDTADIVDTGERTPNPNGGIYRAEQGGATAIVVERWGGETSGYMIVKLVMGSHELNLGQRTIDVDDLATAKAVADEIIERFMNELSGAPALEGADLAREIIAESIRSTGGGFRASYIMMQSGLDEAAAQAVIDEAVEAGLLRPRYSIACSHCSSVAVSTDTLAEIPFGQVIECPMFCDEGYSDEEGASVFEVWDEGSQRVEISYPAVTVKA